MPISKTYFTWYYSLGFYLYLLYLSVLFSFLFFSFLIYCIRLYFHSIFFFAHLKDLMSKLPLNIQRIEIPNPLFVLPVRFNYTKYKTSAVVHLFISHHRLNFLKIYCLKRPNSRRYCWKHDLIRLFNFNYSLLRSVNKTTWHLDCHFQNLAYQVRKQEKKKQSCT